MPTPQRRVVDVPFVNGYKQRDIPAWIDPNSQTDAINAIWTKREAIEKRPGYVEFQSSIDTAGAFAGFAPSQLSTDGFLIPRANGLMSTDGTYLYGIDTADNAELVDFVSPCVVSRLVVSSSERVAVNPDVAYYPAQNWRIYVWQDGASTNTVVQFAIVNGTTRAIVTSGIVDKNNTGVNPKVVVLGDYAYVFWHDTSGNKIYSASMSLTTVNPGGAWTTVTLISNIASGGQFDVAPSDNSQNVALIYEFTTAGAHLDVVQYSASGGTLSGNWSNTVPGTTGTSYRSVGIRYDGVNDRIWTAYAEPSGSVAIHYMTYVASTGVTVINPFQVRGNTGIGADHIGIETLGVDTAAIVFGGLNSSECYVAWAVVQNVAGNGSIIQALQTAHSIQILSRPFAVSTPDTTYPVRVYGWCATSNIQMTNVLVEYDVNGLEPSPRPCAVCCPRLAAVGNTSQAEAIRRNKSALTSVTNVGTPSATQFAAAGTLSINGIELDVYSETLMAAVDMLADFAHPGRFKSAELAGLTYVGGGLPSTLDGVTLAEIGTINEPCGQSPLATATNAGSGALIATQTYSWVFVYAWRDRAGNIYRGQPSVPLALTISGSNQKVDLTIPSMFLTKQGTEWRSALFGDAQLLIEVYRTYFDGSSMSTNFFLVGFTANDTSGATTSFQDNISDSVLIQTSSVLPLYTTGGVIENDCPSSFADMTTHNGRLYGIGDDLRTIWISTQADPTSNSPVRFNDGVQQTIGGMGDLVAIWSMDDKLFVASATAIAYFSGGGPNNVGQQSDLSQPTLLPTDVGVTDCRSVCVTPLGTVFRHALGLGLLDRSLSVHSDFGDPVIDLLAANPVVTSMSLHPTRPELLICAETGPVSGPFLHETGIVLVYNYRFDRWSYWSITDAYSVLGVPHVVHNQISHSLSAANGEMYMALSTGRILREKTTAVDPDPYYDAAQSVHQWVPLTVSSAWIKGGGLQSQARVDDFQTLFTPMDWANLAVAVSYDYGTTWVTPSTWTIPADTIAGFSDVNGTLGSITRMNWTPPTAQCSAFRIRWQDAATVGGVNTSVTGQGFQLLGMSATVLSDEFTRRLPATQGA